MKRGDLLTSALWLAVALGGLLLALLARLFS
jgi:hypothetical protein